MMGTDDVRVDALTITRARLAIEMGYEPSWERSLALAKLDECGLWLTRCKPRGIAEPTIEETAQAAASECLKELTVRIKPGDLPVKSFLGMAVD